MRLLRNFFTKYGLVFLAVLLIVKFTAIPALAQTTSPTELSSCGYINGNAQTTHTTATFNSGGASTLVAFVSTHPAWPWRGAYQ